MSAQSKIDRAKYGPSLTEVTVGALLSLALGGFLAAAYLIAQPVETVRSLPEEPEPGQVYFVEGSRQAPNQAQWMRKRQMLLAGEGGEIALSEAELNSLVASTQGGGAGNDGGLFQATAFNFRVQDDQLQIAVPGTLQLFGLYSQSLIMQARGGFTGKEGDFRYVAKEFMIGSFAAHRVPGLTALLLSRLWPAEGLSEEFTAAWGHLQDVKVVGDQLILTLP